MDLGRQLRDDVALMLKLDHICVDGEALRQVGEKIGTVDLRSYLLSSLAMAVILIRTAARDPESLDAAAEMAPELPWRVINILDMHWWLVRRCELGVRYEIEAREIPVRDVSIIVSLLEQAMSKQKLRDDLAACCKRFSEAIAGLTVRQALGVALEMVASAAAVVAGLAKNDLPEGVIGTPVPLNQPDRSDRRAETCGHRRRSPRKPGSWPR